MVKRFSARLVSKSTYMSKIRDELTNSVKLLCTSIHSKVGREVTKTVCGLKCIYIIILLYVWAVNLIKGCCVCGKTHNSVDEGGDIMQVIRKSVTDVIKKLNGLGQMSHCVPDKHCTVHHLTQKHTQTLICILKKSYIVEIYVCLNCSSNLIKVLPVSHFGVRKHHPTQNSLSRTHTHTYKQRVNKIMLMFRWWHSR